MMPNELWAKSESASGTRPPTIAEHNRDVCCAADSIWSCVGSDLACALGADITQLHDDLLSLLRAAALLHDLGKVNSAFQEMIRARLGQSHKQPVRHEIMSAWLLADADFLGKWFAGLRPEHDTWPIIWAIAGHHLKAGDPALGAKLFNLSDAKYVSVPLSNPQVGQILREVASNLGGAVDSPKLSDRRFDITDDDDDGLEARINAFAERACRAWMRLRNDESTVRRVALLKALLVASDAAASALTSGGQDPGGWIRPSLARRIVPTDLDAVIAKGLKARPAHEFQTRVGASAAPATVVIAGCGNGKTTAAYIWAKNRAVGRKLFFTYPTTGTASAGYQGYLYDHPDLISDLIHGRSGVDLQAMRGTGEKESDDEIRIDSLRVWDRQAVICTVDTVLGLLQNQRRPLYSFPPIAAGAFVFDEIHSYDARLFGGLLRFLKTFPGLPALLMSASIPPTRMAALKDALGERMGDVIHGDPTVEGHLRYRLHKRPDAESCRPDVVMALTANRKVLWVCNTVGDAIKLAQNARMWTKVEPIIYHSRFRYRDRVNRQKELIAQFKSDGCTLAITTQVCEMSLDISADLMVTAECPLPSTVQRLGRLNRYATKDDPWPCLVHPFKGMPYNEDPAFAQTRGDCITSMKACRDVVEELDGEPCSQRDLAERLDRMTGSETFEEYSAWLDDGWVTEPAQVRDGDVSITVIREEDLKEIEKEVGPRKKWTHSNLVPWTIPMLFRGNFYPPDKAGGYPVASTGTIRYCEKEGATWVSEKR